MSFLQTIADTCASRGDETVLVDQDRRLSCSQFRRMTNALAHHLRDISGQEYGFVALLLPRTVLFPVAAVGVMKAGHAFVPMAADNTPEYNQAVLSDSSPFAVITTSDLWARLDWLHALRNIHVILADELLVASGVGDGEINLSREEDPAMLIYTSGTTGHPKAVLHSVRSLGTVCEYCSTLDSAVPSGRRTRAAVLDFCFLGGVVDPFVSLMVGGTCHIVPDDVVRNIDQLSSYLFNNNILSVTTIGHVARMLVRKGAGVRFFEVTGGQMPVIGEPLPEGVVIRNTYGMTECGACLSYLVRGTECPVPVGKPVEGVKVYLLDDSLRPVGEGQTGEIFISSPGLAIGYFHNAAMTEERFAVFPIEKVRRIAGGPDEPEGRIAGGPDEPGGRMFRTGDLARVLPSGDLLYCGRRDDMVKVRGVRINVLEVENAAMSCGGVGQAVAVVTEKGILCLFYSGAVREADLVSRLKSELPSPMMPGRVIRLEAMPVSSHGKIDKAALKAALAGSLSTGAGESGSDLEPVQGRILAAMQSMLGFADIGPDDDFFSFGGDSLNVVELVTVLEDLGLGVVDVYRERTARRVASAVRPEKSARKDPQDGSVRKDPQDGSAGLTLFQKRVLESQLADAGSTMWNNPLLFRLGKDCDFDRLQESLRTVALHHPALSCVPDPSSGCLRYVPGANLPIESVQVDEDETTDSVIGRLTAPFPMSGSPLWRARLFSLKGDAYLFLDFHHLIFDGTSLTVFLSNLFRAYRGETLPADCFFDCAYESAHDCGQLDQGVCLEDGWTYSLFKPAVRTAGMRYFARQSGTSLSEADVESVRRRSGFSLDVFAIAAAALALGKRTGKSDVAVCWMYSSRTSGARRDSFGAYIRMFCIFLKLEGRSTLEILEDVRAQLDLCFAGKRNEYSNRDVLAGSDPVLINNLTGLGLDLKDSPFGIERVDFLYWIKELIEYLDIELYYDEQGGLCLDFSCGNRALDEGVVSSFGDEFSACLEKLIFERI